VRVSGGDPERLDTAARCAAEAGLAVWFSPLPCELTPERMLPLFVDCAERAERLRAAGAPVVLVLGCELSVFGAGFVPGADAYARMAALSSPDPATWAALSDVPGRMNGFLAAAATAARRHTDAPLTYAAGPWEDIDWAPFDIVSLDAYRTADNAAGYVDLLRGHVAGGRPVVATEFGCCTYAGAAARGGAGWAVVDRAATPPRLLDGVVRDEDEQVAEIGATLALLADAGVDGAFWFTFARYGLPYRPDDPAHDLDASSYGLVRLLDGRDDGAWEPKKGFHALAAAYA
jgi:hypothetical protein